MSIQKRILFVGEAVTLAHVARPLVLAEYLDAQRFSVHFACALRSQQFLPQTWPFHPIESIPSAQFLDSLAQGRPVYDFQTLQRYVEADLALLDQVKPDLVIGDFRLSLSVSARLAGVPYAAVSNAYWSPHVPQRFPLPPHPMISILGLKIASAVFAGVRPLAFAYHALPLQRLRRHYGLPGLGFNLRRSYTDADQVLYADVAEQYGSPTLPKQHHFIGPLLWSPPVETPDWWADIPEHRPLIYITLGSSGQAELLPPLIQALRDLPVSLLVASVGQPTGPISANVFCADYLPGIAACARASLVICNGGSPTSQQAIAAGKPVLGIAGNMDQMLNMASLVKIGAGVMLRGDRFRPEHLRAQVEQMLRTPTYTQAAASLGQIYATYDSRQRFLQFLREIAL